MPNRVQTCIEWNVATQSCDVSAWVEQASLLPPMTLEEGKEIGDAIIYGLVLVVIVKLFFKPSTHRAR